MTTPPTSLWQDSVGELPHKVTAYERPEKGGIVYLRWRAAGNWKHRSLKRTVRTGDGRLIAKAVTWALQQARMQYEKLVAGLPDDERPATLERPLTIAEGLALAVDPKRGKYKVDTPHRRELVRSLQHAIRVWGTERTWNSIRKADLAELWCDRIDALASRGHKGHRSAAIVIRDVLAVASFLRGEERIPPGACLVPGKVWKAELMKDWREKTGSDREYRPERPRHTLAELRAILAVLPTADPRFRLALDLGAEDRLGQVIRCRRSDLDLEEGRLSIHGLAHKRGTRVSLTAGQLEVTRAALETGYLRELEAEYQRTGADYCLFPAGQLQGSREGLGDGTKSNRVTPAKGYATVAVHGARKPITRSRLDDWFRKVEQAAGVPHIAGRGAYGLRRQATDAATDLGISPEGLQALGGWADLQMPDRIYRDKRRQKAEDEARDTRAKMRGEAGEAPENART